MWGLGDLVCDLFATRIAGDDGLPVCRPAAGAGVLAQLARPATGAVPAGAGTSSPRSPLTDRTGGH